MANWHPEERLQSLGSRRFPHFLMVGDHGAEVAASVGCRRFRSTMNSSYAFVTTILLVALFSAHFLSISDALAEDLRSNSGVIQLERVFPLGKGSFVSCYTDNPSFIFALGNLDGINSIRFVPFDGPPTDLFGFSGKIVSPTLSCSDDGKTIAFVRKGAGNTDYDLIIIKSGVPSLYRLGHWTTFFPIVGTTSLLSEDGDAIALPANPEHISGPDIIRSMRLFVYDGKAFFSNGSIIHDSGMAIEQLSFEDGQWARHAVIDKNPSLFVEQAGYCFGHTIAVVQVDESNESARLYDITHGKLASLPPEFSSVVRLNDRGSGAMSPIASASQYGRCVYLFGKFEEEIPRFTLTDVATVDRTGATVYAVPTGLVANGEGITLESFRVGLTKDGCNLLISTYPKQPNAPQDYGGEGHVLVLKLKNSRGTCN